MPKARQGNLVRKLFAAFGMSFAKAGHTICRPACFVGKATGPLVSMRKPLAVRIICYSFRPTQYFSSCCRRWQRRGKAAQINAGYINCALAKVVYFCLCKFFFGARPKVDFSATMQFAMVDLVRRLFLPCGCFSRKVLFPSSLTCRCTGRIGWRRCAGELNVGQKCVALALHPPASLPTAMLLTTECPGQQTRANQSS